MTALGLLLCVPLAGCGGGGGGGSTSVVAPTPTPLPPTPLPPPPAPTPPPAVVTVAAPALQNFTASLAEDRSTVGVGGTVNYTLRLTNTSSVAAPIIVTTENGQTVPRAALQVVDAGGTTVYPVQRPITTHADPPPPPTLDLPVTLAPGQSLGVIVRPVTAYGAAGTYQATATFSVAANGADPVQMVTLPPLAVTAQ